MVAVRPGLVPRDALTYAPDITSPRRRTSVASTPAPPPGPIIVRKYGGSSLADIDRLRAVARDLKSVHAAGNHLVVVVSAMGDTTDRLVAQARQVSPQPPRRELDMLLTVGERITMSLLCMALDAEGVPALSLTGSQSGIITDASHNDARILAVRPIRVPEALAAGKVVVVAGFQGVCGDTKEITTLGRGGSDTTAVALAHALGAERCEILKDVAGVMTADPKLVPGARRIEQLDYDTMQRLADAGCGVVHARAVEYARQHDVPLHVASSFDPGPGTTIGPTASPPLPDSPAFAPLALTAGKDQARLVLDAPTASRQPDLVAITRRAAASGPLPAQWLAAGDRWSWEAWGPRTHLADAAAEALALAAAAPGHVTAHWEDQLALLTLVGRRPDSWPHGLMEIRERLLALGCGEAPLRTDGDAVRILVPASESPRLASALHEALLGS
jgi:aspartate kinase